MKIYQITLNFDTVGYFSTEGKAIAAALDLEDKILRGQLLMRRKLYDIVVTECSVDEPKCTFETMARFEGSVPKFTIDEPEIPTLEEWLETPSYFGYTWGNFVYAGGLWHLNAKFDNLFEIYDKAEEERDLEGYDDFCKNKEIYSAYCRCLYDE